MLKIFKVPRLDHLVVGFLFMFLLLFPKGGIKLATKPVTIGYLLLMLTSLGLIFRNTFSYNKQLIKAILYLLPFQLCSLISILINGWENLIILSSFIIHFFVLPFTFYFLFPKSLSKDLHSLILKWIKNGVTIVAIYGIFLFFYKLITGKFIEIPFLTVNYHDLHLLETEKCIDRGGYFKLISTYNNGNLFGICILMLYPLYTFLEKNKLCRLLVSLALILTLSRTVWIGLFIAELLNLFSSANKNSKSFRNAILCLLFFVTALAILGILLDLPAAFFLDRTLGHRINQFEVLKTFSLFGNEAFSGIFEITYLGIYKSFGIVGLGTFFAAMTFPMFMISRSSSLHKDPILKKLAYGLLLYNIISFSDGAILLIPVMSFYWFICWFGLSVVNCSSSIFIERDSTNP